MKTELKQAYNVELTAACEAEESRNFSKAFAHLERAHILSQKYAWAHTRTHIRMLKLGWRTRDMGSTPLLRTFLKRGTLCQRSVHVQTQKI